MACPICQRKADPKLRLFCSKRCADIDLAKWFTGSYAIPSDDPEDMEEAAVQADEAARLRPN
ncbi:MAG: DNA gyrase inhibitor YacG [Pseudomonadota bacterium]